MECFNIDNYLEKLILRCKDSFDERLVYVGLQGSWLPPATRQDEVNYIKISLGNFYHEICHRYIHAGEEKSRNKLRASCKQLYFVIQNLHYLESGEFLLKKSDLKATVSAQDREMLCIPELPDDYDFEKTYEAVIAWCQKAFARIK